MHCLRLELSPPHKFNYNWCGKCKVCFPKKQLKTTNSPFIIAIKNSLTNQSPNNLYQKGNLLKDIQPSIQG